MKKLFVVLSLVGAFAASQAHAGKVYKMYDKPHAQPNEFCDKYTQLEITSVTSTTVVVQLMNRLAGACEIFVSPNPRSYTLRFTEDDCGTKIYQSDANGDSAARLTDNSTRRCENVIPALIILDERDTRTGAVRRLYSKD